MHIQGSTQDKALIKGSQDCTREVGLKNHTDKGRRLVETDAMTKLHNHPQLRALVQGFPRTALVNVARELGLSLDQEFDVCPTFSVMMRHIKSPTKQMAQLLKSTDLDGEARAVVRVLFGLLRENNDRDTQRSKQRKGEAH